MEVPLRVVARVRPPSEDEDMCIHVVPTSSHVLIGSDENFFHFDAVFSQEADQKELYSTCLEDIVTTFFRGVNGTVVTYGQKGSGKSFTMIGPEFPCAMNEEQFGFIPRAIRHIFRMMEDNPHREYFVRISYFIIHQESVYDLLSSVSSGHSLAELNILEDNLGNVGIPGCSIVDCYNINDLLCCLLEGLSQRHSATTQGFDLTDAHCIFTFRLEHRWIDEDSRVNSLYSRMDFVDLAGENSSFNYSNVISPREDLLLPRSDLKAFRNVIHCLANRNAVIPYKDSKLTHILKDGFGGNSRTLMVCCLSPSSKDMEVSFNTSKLGYHASYITNIPILNLVQNSIQATNVANSPINTQMSSRSSTQTGNQSSRQSMNNASISGGISAPPMQQLPILNQPLISHHNLPPSTQPNGVGGRDIHNMEEDRIFRVQFAASQWHLLVSSAENLLAEILQNGSLSPSERSRIESWLCMKAEAEDCIGDDLSPLQAMQGSGRSLDVIEELSEPNDQNCSSRSSSSSCDGESEISFDSFNLDEEHHKSLELHKEEFLESTAEVVKCIESEYDTKEKALLLKKQLHPTAEDRMSISLSQEKIPVNGSNAVAKDGETIDAKVTDSKTGLLQKFNNDNLISPSVVSKEIQYSLKEHLVKRPKIKASRNKATNLPYSHPGDTESLPTDTTDSKCSEESDSELLRKVSSKLLSVSKGSSKCVDSLKNKSSQLKRSIKSHIFKRRNKNSQFPQGLIGSSTISYPLDSQPCIVRGMNVDLKANKNKLQEMNATIKAKEALIIELKRGGEEIELTKKKCKSKMLKLEDELRLLDRLYFKAQLKLKEANNEEERIHYKKNIDEYQREMKQMKKNLTYLQKLSHISSASKLNITELEASIQKLREQSEELQTKLREESQRKKQLEQQIFRDERCARKLLQSTDMFDEDSDDYHLDKDSKSVFQAPPPLLKDDLCSPPQASQSLKRKLTNSAGDSQSDQAGQDLSSSNFRGERKAGRLEAPERVDDRNVVLRSEISQLREAKEGILLKKQKLVKKIKKGRTDSKEVDRRILELDETVEGLDGVIEYKNQLLCDGGRTLENAASLLTKYDLIGILRNLSLEELRHLLIRYFNRVIDLRIEFRQQELMFADLEHNYDEQERLLRTMKEAYQQASLKMERHVTSLHRDYQYKISVLHRHFNKDNSGYEVEELHLFDLEKQLNYYKKRNGELKDRLRKHLYEHQQQGHSMPLPGTSGLKSRVLNVEGNNYVGGGIEPSSSTVNNNLGFRRGRRSALVDENGAGAAPGGGLMKVIREKNKIILRPKDCEEINR